MKHEKHSMHLHKMLWLMYKELIQSAVEVWVFLRITRCQYLCICI